MKKFLSLVLALVMTMSLVTISAGAKEFTDDADITYDEAVAVISEIGVVDGYTDGKFNPTDGLTRGAAAKIICNLILGPTTAAELHADTAPYPDVPLSNTFSGYIAYCAKEGIISGYADGTFKPAAPLTGYAFMKMLLGALGYDSAYEGYTGANWSVNVAKQAIGIGLNKGLTEEFNGVDYVTREEAALYAFNTLKATMVGYENKITANVNGADVTISNTQAYPVTWSEGINKDGNIKNDGFVQFAEEFFPKLVRKDDSTKFMEPANTWIYDKTQIGTYERYDLLVESYTAGVTGKEVYDLLGAGVIKGNELESYLDGDDNTITTANLVRSNDSNLTGTGNGVLTKVYLDTDKDLITIVSINTWLAQATADYSESKEYAPLKVYTGIDQTASYNVDVEDVSNVVDVKNETFYQVTISYKDSTRGEIVTVAPAEVLEDSTVTKFSAENGNEKDKVRYVTKLTTGGEEYKRNVKAFYDKDVLNIYDEDLLTDATYNVYLDSNGYFIGVSLFEGVKNYVFITGYDRPTSNLSVKTADAAAIFLDGTMKQIKVNVKNTNENIADAQTSTYGTPAYFTDWVAGGSYRLNRWYTYTVDADGVYTLKPAVRMTATNYTADTTINTANLRVSDNVLNYVRGNVYGEDASVFLTVDLDEVDPTLGTPNPERAITEVTGVYTGVQEVEIEIDPGTAIEEAEVYTVYDSDYFIIGAVVVGEGKGNAANIAYILDGAKSEERKDDTYYWEFDAIVDGQVQTLTAKSKYLDTIRALRNDADGIVELRFDGDYVVNVKDVDDIYGNAHYTNSAYDTSDFAVYDVTRANELHLQGRTLYVMANQADMGLALKSDAKAVTIQTENTKTNVKTEFTSVSAAISHLADADPRVSGLQYSGRIIAALDSTGAATWVVFVSNTPLSTGSQGGGSTPVDSNMYRPATWNATTQQFDLRYHGTILTDSEIMAAIGDELGQPVARLNRYLGVAVLENGDMYPVNFTQIPVVSISINGSVVGYADRGFSKTLTGIPAGYYLPIDTYSTGVNSSASNVGTDGKLTISSTATDRKLVSAYQVTGLGGKVTATLDDTALTPVNNNDYVAAGKTLVVTFATDVTAKDYKLNGQLVRVPATAPGVADVVVKVPMTGAVTVAPVSNYMTGAELQSAISSGLDGKGYTEGTEVPVTNAKITRTGNTLNVVVNAGQNIADVSGTNLLSGAATLIAGGNTVTLSFANGEKLVIDASAASNLLALKATLVNMIGRQTQPTAVTVTVTNTASGQSVNYTVNISTASV